MTGRGRSGWTFEERIADKIIKQPNGCWLWVGATYLNGYGVVKYNGRNRPAHSAMYEHFVGPIPDGTEIGHKDFCHNRKCVNPEHVEPMTHYDNMQDRFNPKPKLFCLQGHPLVDENIANSTDGRRRCLICRRARDTEYYYARKGF